MTVQWSMWQGNAVILVDMISIQTVRIYIYIMLRKTNRCDTVSSLENFKRFALLAWPWRLLSRILHLVEHTHGPATRGSIWLLHAFGYLFLHVRYWWIICWNEWFNISALRFSTFARLTVDFHFLFIIPTRCSSKCIHKLQIHYLVVAIILGFNMPCDELFNEWMVITDYLSVLISTT